MIYTKTENKITFHLCGGNLNINRRKMQKLPIDPEITRLFMREKRRA